MPKFEFQFWEFILDSEDVDLPYAVVSVNDETLKPYRRLTEMLAEAGAAGWHLAAAFNDPRANSERMLFFQREVPE